MHGDIVEIRNDYPPLLHQSHTDGVDTVLAVAGPAGERHIKPTPARYLMLSLSLKY